MMKQEFEKIAGYEVSFEDYYGIIEPMYLATDLSKHEFVKTLNRSRFALKTKQELLTEIKRLARKIKRSCDSHQDYESEQKLYELVDELRQRFSFDYCVRTSFTERGCPYPAVITEYSGEYSFREIVLTV